MSPCRLCFRTSISARWFRVVVFASAAFDTDAIIAAIENQSLPVTVPARRVGHARRSGGGSGQHVFAGLAGVDELLAGAAAALGADHDVAARRHAVDLGRAAVFAGVIAGRQKHQVYFAGGGGRVAGLGDDLPSAPPCMTTLRSAAEYFRSPPRTRMTLGCAGSSAIVSGADCRRR